MGPVEARFRAAIELRELTIAMRRQRLIREHSGEPEERTQRRLREWVLGTPPVDQRPSEAT